MATTTETEVKIENDNATPTETVPVKVDASDKEEQENQTMQKAAEGRRRNKTIDNSKKQLAKRQQLLDKLKQGSTQILIEVNKPPLRRVNHSTISSFLQEISSNLKRNDPQKDARIWTQRFAQNNINTIGELMNAIQIRKTWHRIKLPAAIKIAIDEAFVKGLQLDLPLSLQEVSYEDDNLVLYHMTPSLIRVLKKGEGKELRKIAIAEQQEQMRGFLEERGLYFSEDDLMRTATEIGMSIDGPDLDKPTKEQESLAKQPHVMFNAEEIEWIQRVNDLVQIRHGLAVARLYFCGSEDTDWTFTGLMGGLTLITETTLTNVPAHYLRLVDLEGWNPNNSIIFEQEFYKGFEFNKTNPLFYTFESDEGVVGLSFINEKEADVFAERVAICKSRSAEDVVDEFLEQRERSYIAVGSNKIGVADNVENAKVHRKYAQGGIADGIEIKWSKPKPPPELAGVLGTGTEETEEELLKKKEEQIMKLLGTTHSNATKLKKGEVEGASNSLFAEGNQKVADGIQISWSKNSTTLSNSQKAKTDDSPSAASRFQKNKKKRKSIASLYSLKSKR